MLKDYLCLVTNFLKFARYNTTLLIRLNINHLIYSPPTPYKVDKHFIINFNETPIPFEFLNSATYDIRGNNIITGKTERSG